MVSGRAGCWSALPLPRRLDPSEASSKPLGLSLQNGLAPRGPQPWSGGRTSAPQSSSPARSPAGSEEPPWCLSGGRLQQLARRRAGRLASKPGFASLNIILVLGTRGGPTVPPYALLGGKHSFAWKVDGAMPPQPGSVCLPLSRASYLTRPCESCLHV